MNTSKAVAAAFGPHLHNAVDDDAVLDEADATSAPLPSAQSSQRAVSLRLGCVSIPTLDGGERTPLDTRRAPEL